MNRPLTRPLLLSTVALLSVPTSAFAASDAEAPSAEAPSDLGPDIVVTARRREEKVQDVPIAISVVGADTLDKTGSFTLGQIQQLVPSMQVFSFNPRNTNINIRGLGSNVALTNDGLENGVGFYVDNVYYGRPGQSQFDLVDLQQVEVLRGPQGTLFGKNTTAGAINITTRLPSFDPEFQGEATIGDYGYHQVRGSLSAPIIDDKVAFRLSVADTHRDGFLTNRFNGRKAQDYDNFTVRGQLLVKPAENLSIRIIGDYSHQKQNYVLNIPVAYFTTYDNGAPIANNFLERAARLNYTPVPARPFDRIGDSDARYQAFMQAYGVSGEVNWDLGPVALTSITSYRWWDWDPANDGDSTSLSIGTLAQQANRQRQFSQEVRLASNGKNSVDWVVGAYYFHQIVRGYGAVGFGPDAAAWNVPTVDPVAANAALSGYTTNSYSDPKTKSYALFGQATWHITDALSLTGGLRYTHEKKTGSYTNIVLAGADLSTLTPVQQATAQALRAQFSPVASYSAQLSDDSLSGLLSLGWKVTPDVLLYGSYSRGNKSGGLNLTFLPAGISPTVAPERVDSFEIGLKTQLFDNKVIFNLAAFNSNVTDYQTAITEISAIGRAVQYISNIPKVRSRGVEADLSYSPSRWVTLSASVAYTDTTYRDYTNAPQAPERPAPATQNLSGSQVPGVPKWTYSLSADLAQPVGDLFGRSTEAYGRADYSYRTRYNTSSSSSRYGEVPGYGLLNARIGIRSEDGLWDLSAWVKNLLNKDYFQALNPGASGAVTGTIGEPRTAGLTLRTKL